MSWRFALTPSWIVRHVAVVLLVVAMVAAGFWQLRRLDDKREYKALVAERQQEPAAPVDEVVPFDAEVDAPGVDDVLYRTVTAEGTYAADDTVVVENRTFNSAPGAWVLTPLVLRDGRAVVVNRGFIGFTREGEIAPPPAPPLPVRVEGLLFQSQERSSFGATDADAGKLEVLARVDLDRFEAQLDREIYPAYLQLTDSDPAEPAPTAGAPQLVALGPPEPDEGPHLAYAGQWFTFSAIATGGYAILLRRIARDRGRAQERAATDAASGPDPGPAPHPGAHAA
ncbi:MAG: SURF1 family protein [Acidimicrobiales bacterium]|nr:SURF1 family protein [Acidimicrobiales bacterium]